MPLYNYRCPQCDVVRELLTKYEDHVACGICGIECIREISAGTFKLFGDGFYSPTGKDDE